MPEILAPSQVSNTDRMQRISSWKIFGILLVAVTAPLFHLHFVNRNMPPGKADLVALWKGTQAALHGQNPYADSTTRAIQTAYYGRPLTSTDHVNLMGYAYPMHAVIFFAPVARLQWPTVRLAF